MTDVLLVLPCCLPRHTELPVPGVFFDLLGQQARIAIPFPFVGGFSWESYVVLSKRVRTMPEGRLLPLIAVDLRE